MTKISAQAVKELRELTNLGMMECKRLLAEAGGDLEKAKAAAIEAGKDTGKIKSREATEGIVANYMHHNGKVGVLVELDCNTDFVSRNDAFRQLAKDLAMHIAAMKPLVVRREELDQQLVEKRRNYLAGEVGSGKPPEIVDRIVSGKMDRWFADRVLLDQPFAKDDSKKVSELIEEMVRTTGENVTVARFAHFVVGESGAAGEDGADEEE